MGRDKRTKASFAFGVAVLVALIWAVWTQVGGFEFIQLDDDKYVYNYASVAGGLSWANFKAVCRNLTQGGIWMPLTSLTYMFEISAFGSGPGPHHLMSVVWHSVNAILVFSFIYELTDRKSLFAAFVGAALWAVHPQRCESVTWIASRKDLVFTFFTLLGLIAWRRGHAFLAYFLMFASCCSKPTAMVFPVLAFCVEKDAPLIFAKLKQAPFQTFKSYFIRYLPMVVLTVATAILTVYSQTNCEGEGGRGLTEGYGPLPYRVLNAVVAIGLYFAQLVVPYGIHILYLLRINAVPDCMWLGLAVVAVLTAGLLWAAVRRRGWSRLWLMALWFLASVGPTLGIVGCCGNHSRADRFLYVPMIAVSVLAAWGLSEVKLRGWMRAAIVAALAGYASAAFLNARTYRSDYALFRRALDCDENHGIALWHVATHEVRDPKTVDQALDRYRRLVAVAHDGNAAATLMYVLATRGRAEDFPEIKFRGQVLIENPELDEGGMAVEALGMVALREGDPVSAVRFLSAAVNAPKRKLPTDEANVQLAMSYYNIADYRRARKLFRELVDSRNERVRRHAQRSLQVLDERHPEETP